MILFSKDEIKLTKNLLCSNIRLDKRTFNSTRRVDSKNVEIFQSDGTIETTAGESKVKISIQFKESPKTLDGEIPVDDIEEETITSNHPIPVVMKEKILEFCDTYCIGLRIDFDIISDDGNTFDLFVDALRNIFKRIRVPDYKNLENEIETSLSLPKSKTFAIIDDKILQDPSKIEEECCDYIVRCIYDDNKNILSLWTEKTADINLDLLKRILNSL